MSALRFCQSIRQLVVSTALGTLLLVTGRPVSAGDFDVDQLSVAKTATFLQLGPDIFVERPLLLEGHLEVLPWRDGGLVSGRVFTPASETVELTRDNRGALVFDAGFETIELWNAAVPNGRYFFDLVTVTEPRQYQDFVDFAEDFPGLPRIANSEWYQIVIQMNALRPFTFRWSDFADFRSGPGSLSRIRFEIVNSLDEVVHTETFDSPRTETTIPANLLVPGEFYVGRVFFGHVNQEADDLTAFESISALGTAFIISAVDGPPEIIPPLETTISRGQFFVYVVNATNHPGSFNVSDLPTELSGTRIQQGEVIQDRNFGIVAGFPSQTVRWPVSATNSLGTGTNTFTLTVQDPGPLQITSSTAATGAVGAPFSYQVLAPGATADARLTTTGLPPGLAADDVSGEISGTPTAAGRFPVELRVTDGNATATSPLEITVKDDPAFPNIISPDTVTISPGQNFTYRIRAPAGANTTTDETTYRLVGDLPAGLTFDPKTGTISGRFGGSPARNGDPGEARRVSGGVIVGSVQLFANNSRGTATLPLVFLTPPVGAVNISTRMPVESGDNVLIAGFIVTGNAPKKLILRAIGPSLRAGEGPLPGALQDPVLELYNDRGELLKTNDDWKSDNQQAIIDTTVPPSHDRESAIVAAFQPGNYTAIVRGKNGSGGIGLVELYDLGTASIASDSNAKLAQISTRGRVQTGDNVMIGGFIISTVSSKVIVRAIGPSLPNLPGALQDPTLELRDGNGSVIAANDDWRSDQQDEIIATTVPPADDRESAIVRTLDAGGYTAIVRGAGDSTGIGLVEVYVLQ